MAILRAFTRPSQAYAKDTVVLIPETRISTGIVEIQLFLTREGWPGTGGEVVRGGFELSLDNRRTWFQCGGFGAAGGERFRAGAPSTESGIIVKVPDPTNNQRWLRGQVTALEGITTSVRVEVYDGVA